MLLYHFNLAGRWQMKAQIFYGRNWQPRDESSKLIFNENNNFRKCPPVMEEHAGAGEAAAFIDCNTDDTGQCCCGLYNAQLELAVALRFQKQQLPWLTNWQHWGEREYVTGLEPGTNKVIGQKKARAEGSLIMLQPGETKCYELELEVMYDRRKIEAFRQQSDSSLITSFS
jgi:hypothetical protein